MDWASTGDRTFIRLMFHGLARQLMDHYITLHEQASDENDQLHWQERMNDLRERKHSTDLDNTEALMSCVESWSEVLEDLKAFDSW